VEFDVKAAMQTALPGHTVSQLAINDFTTLTDRATGVTYQIISMLIRDPHNAATADVYYMVRHQDGSYELTTLSPLGSQPLNATRTFLASPFADEPDVVYIGGFFVVSPNSKQKFHNSAWIEKAVLPDTAPTAGADAWTVPAGDTLTFTAADLLANDGDVDRFDGIPDRLQVVAESISAPASGGQLQFDTATQTFLYVPAPGFSGVDSFTYRISDGYQESAPAMVRINVALNFGNVALANHGGSAQNPAGQSAAAVLDGGATLQLAGNGWRSLAGSYVITANTILEFDFTSPVQGEVQGIGFDIDNKVANSDGAHFVQVYGTQAWGIRTAGTYAGSGTQHFRIELGKLFTGTFNRLVFATDDDVTNPMAVSLFGNVRLFEAA
jgi:hypothetical protein